jgi:nucleotide-binding universal stress UspA family protein
MIVGSDIFRKIPCHVVHVGKDGEKLIAEAKSFLLAAGVKATCALLEGPVEQALVDYQLEKDIDLTFMGAFSHSRFRDLLLGSFTAKMLAATNRPLLLLR